MRLRFAATVTMRKPWRPGWMIALAGILPLAGATKYVAKIGSDANDGSSLAQAYLTIAKGLQNIGAGGRLYIGGGLYEEALINAIPPGASDDARTIVTNYAGETVTIRPGTGRARVLEFSRASRYITVAASAPSRIVLDGTNVAHNVVKFSAPRGGGSRGWPSHIRLENLEIRNSPNSAVLGFSQGCEFIGLIIHHAGRTVFDHGMYIEGSDNVIDGCDIHHNFARGIQIFMEGKKADRVFASRNTVRNCQIHDNGLTPGSVKPGVDADSGTGNLIYNNLIYRNGEFGLMIQMGGAGNAAYHNTFFGNGNAAIRIRSSAGAGSDLRNNLAWANGSGPQFIDDRGDAATRGNLWDGTDPRFASTDPADPGFLKLTANSTPALDCGTAASPIDTLITTDLWGDHRPQGSGYDIGAHEFRATIVGRASR